MFREHPPPPFLSLTAPAAWDTAWMNLQHVTKIFLFSNIDRRDSGLLTQQQFRAAIEGRFELNMTDQEFDLFLKKVPIDSDGMVKYVEFMSKFDTL